MHILLAEDDAVTRRTLQRTLENWGHQVTAAADGEEAWLVWEAGGIQMVVSDWMMPRLDGPGLCRRIRVAERGLDRRAYLMLLTSKGTVDDLTVGLEAGADDFLAKPVAQAELHARLHAGARLLVLQDQLLESHREMQKLALTDPLTDLYNRRALMGILRKDEDRSRRDGKAMGVVVADVDHFKSINDQYGHDVGDKVLQVVAECLQASIRGGDQVGRWGGEEFLMVLPGADVIQAAEVAERCRKLLASRRIPAPNGDIIHVRASFGAASTDAEDRVDVMALVSQADHAMYWAKEGGRNRVKIWVPGSQRNRNQNRKAG